MLLKHRALSGAATNRALEPQWIHADVFSLENLPETERGEEWGIQCEQEAVGVVDNSAENVSETIAGISKPGYDRSRGWRL